MSEVLHPEETITSCLLIRHGHTRATEEGLLYTDPEAPLTKKGQAQAEALSKWLPGQKPDLLISSPSLRVRSTAAIIASVLELEPIIIADLNEWHVGQWEGRTYLDIKKSEPELYHRWSADPINNAPPGGESIAQMCLRVKGILESIISRFAGKRIALVTHAGIIRAAIVEALSIPVENFWRLSVPVGSVSRLDYSVSFTTLHYMSFRAETLKAV